MTDKPLIVDNIDVSKCEFLIITNDKHLCRCIKSDLFGGIEFVENAKKGNCEDNPNCYYKQLQQEKQSSQESRDTSIKEFNRAEELNTLFKYKQQECDRLKHDNEYEVGALEKTIDNLTAENEDLERLYKELGSGDRRFHLYAYRHQFPHEYGIQSGDRYGNDFG